MWERAAVTFLSENQALTHTLRSSLFQIRVKK